MLPCVILTEQTGGYAKCLMSNSSHFDSVFASQPVGKPLGCYVLLVAPEAHINYLFILMQLEVAKVEEGVERESMKEKSQ